ncbi:rod shape-determining protein MreD [Hyunsoonleella pacifica]|uniref:Rod shape-determining protein MreD n=1 Tax=Hyunsoonleella pacifica TaxID=1080224 RepID=A0A4V6MT73_9FLAO|nr:rod shape-determining protein MreD [Hyunsoonleella pacifica]TBN14468.1 rod shape-determining protein MreD [Hyunsoonleella pacifica]GGD13971.1 rod shape-determining protein MreD [Hyunsoonleella pacifica]
MNSIITGQSIRFILLVLFQVILFNHINFLGYINPYIYIIFIIFYPIKNNRLLFLFLAFLIGLTVDMFSDSGGIHASASVFIAYARPAFLKFSFGTMYEHNNVKFDNTDFGAKLTYIALLALLHHIILFSLEIFSISRILMVFQKTLFSGIFTILMITLISIIFSRKN